MGNSSGKFPIKPVIEDEQRLVDVALDITLYSNEITMDELQFVVSEYQRLCPRGRIKRYKNAERTIWGRFDPDNANEVFKNVKKRLDGGRHAEVGLWDGEMEESWSLRCHRLPVKKGKPEQGFYRILMPKSTSPQLMLSIATAIGGGVKFQSGHGGYSFTYDGYFKEDSFEYIYPLARRYWGIDVEDINNTLPLMNKGIKCVNWLTLVGRAFLKKLEWSTQDELLVDAKGVAEKALTHGRLIVAGEEPTIGDRNRRGKGLQQYFDVAKVVAPVQIKSHPEFDGQFSEEENTFAWFLRFTEPEGWST